MNPRSTRSRAIIGGVASLALLLGAIALGASLGASLGGDEASTEAATAPNATATADGPPPSGDYDY